MPEQSHDPLWEHGPDASEQDDRPWEQPGFLRRDYEPHRGKLIYFLGLCSFVCSLFTFLYGIGFFLSLALGVPIWVMAKGDLSEMKTGRMTPEGKAATLDGLWLAQAGVIVSIWFGVFGLIFLIVVFGK